MNHLKSAPTRSAGLSRQGFTLTEMLVAVGAMALLSLGVAQVFSLTTKTVAAGRRLSNLNAVASATERQMRADFSAITSRGPMVIRNQIANGGANVEAYPADPNGRRRRIDEIVFFATGHFTSQQQPVTADGSAVGSGEAMIYYGHGARQNPQANNATGFNRAVGIDDLNAAAPQLGVNTGPGGSKVNQYASEWTLARRAFVLAPPSPQIVRAVPTGQGFPRAVATDSANEVSGLPAVPSPSRADSLNWMAPSMADATLRLGKPSLASGVVDIIAMDLRSVAAQLSDVWIPNGGNSFGTDLRSLELPVGLTGGGAATARLQQAWMRTLFPADSDGGRRMRVEHTPPDFLNMNNGAATPAQRSDQLMLSSGAFLPRCSEFIVEYSFGRSFQGIASGPNAEPRGPSTPGVTSVGDIYWHGLDRKVGTDPAAPASYGRDVFRYEAWVSANGTALTQPVRRRNPASLPAPRSATRDIKILPDLIEPRAVPAWSGSPGWAISPSTSYAFFGLTDPYYAPDTTLLARDVDGNGQYNWQKGDVLQEPESLAWARPTMIRVTLTICDPTDPSIEQTFQFVFDLPRDVRNSEM